MNTIFIERGVFRIPCHYIENGEKVTDGGWEKDGAGTTLAIGEFDDDFKQVGTANLFAAWQHKAIADEIINLLDLPFAEDYPDIIEIAKNMKRDGYDVCDFCESYHCSTCQLKCDLEEDDEK